MTQDDPLLAPQGEAEALPSIRDAQDDTKRIGTASIYGGQGDKKHLGGFTEVDIHGISPYVWRMMMGEYGIKSVIDVGCGRGISTLWFAMNGMDALCVEGSHDAYEKTVLPNPATQMVEHDFSRGPWWPTKTYDAVWSVEFLEHVGRNFHQNYLPVFRSAAIIFATHSVSARGKLWS
jgi:2-polyprenyl-3-methyl-5-hydroxy-6-metoxy-1,4-benzoquinol methylase